MGVRVEVDLVKRTSSTERGERNSPLTGERKNPSFLDCVNSVL